MTSPRAETFYIKILGRYGILTLAMFAPFFWFAWPHYLALISITVGIALFFVVVVLICTVSVTDDGIVLFRLNRAPWDDINAVERTSFLGLPYLFIFRVRGFRWWLPLYLRQEQKFRAALISRAPVGHPLREYAEGKI